VCEITPLTSAISEKSHGSLQVSFRQRK